MNGGVSKADRESELRRGTSLLLILIGILSLSANGQSPSPANSATIASESSLPRKVVVPISVVNRFFPEVTREASTGQNLTAVGNPKATRSVIYANSDSSKKVTITVDQYPTASDASSAYQEAVAKSKSVPGFKPVPAENLGQERLCRNRDSGRRDAHRPWRATRHADRGSNAGGLRSHARQHAKLISLTREEERAAKAAMRSKPTEIVARLPQIISAFLSFHSFVIRAVSICAK